MRRRRGRGARRATRRPRARRWRRADAPRRRRPGGALRPSASACARRADERNVVGFIHVVALVLVLTALRPGAAHVLVQGVKMREDVRRVGRARSTFRASRRRARSERQRFGPRERRGVCCARRRRPRGTARAVRPPRPARARRLRGRARAQLGRLGRELSGGGARARAPRAVDRHRKLAARACAFAARLPAALHPRTPVAAGGRPVQDGGPWKLPSAPFFLWRVDLSVRWAAGRTRPLSHRLAA